MAANHTQKEPNEHSSPSPPPLPTTTTTTFALLQTYEEHFSAVSLMQNGHQSGGFGPGSTNSREEKQGWIQHQKPQNQTAAPRAHAAYSFPEPIHSHKERSRDSHSGSCIRTRVLTNAAMLVHVSCDNDAATRFTWLAANAAPAEVCHHCSPCSLSNMCSQACSCHTLPPTMAYCTRRPTVRPTVLRPTWQQGPQ